jgi:hypothetical protein
LFLKQTLANFKPLVAIVLFFLFFLALFIIFPLTNTLPGNCDSLLLISYSNYNLEYFFSFLNGEDIGTAMYPVLDPTSYGESAPGAQLLFLFFRLLGFDNYWSYYFFLVVIFSLNGFGLFLFSGHFLKRSVSRFFCGFAFSCSNMAFAHIDDTIVFFYFPTFLSLFFVGRWFENCHKKFFFFSALSASLIVYFSFYVFFYSIFIISFFFFFLSFRNGIAIKTTLLRALVFAILPLLTSIPHVFFHLHTLNGLSFLNPFDPMYTTQMTSLSPFDLALALPDNRIYGGIVEVPTMNWGFVRHHNFISLLMVFFALFALLKTKGHRLLFVLLIFLGISLSIGPYFMFGTKVLAPSPLLFFYESIPILSFLRVTVRAYFIVLFSIAVLAAIFVDYLLLHTNNRYAKHALIAVIFVVHLFENVPLPLKSFDIPLAYHQESYSSIVKKDPQAIILDLPSRLHIGYINWDKYIYADPTSHIAQDNDVEEASIRNNGMFVNSWNSVFEYNREIIYTSWQTKHKLNTVNGVNGYFPTPRIIFQYHINKLPEPGSFTWLFKHGVRYIVYHRDMVIPEDTHKEEDIERSRCTKVFYESANSIVFEILDQCV